MVSSAAACPSCCTSRTPQVQWQAPPASSGRAQMAAPSAATQRRQRGASLVAHADAAVLQEIIVGSAVTAATAAALINGSSKVSLFAWKNRQTWPIQLSALLGSFSPLLMLLSFMVPTPASGRARSVQLLCWHRRHQVLCV
jgi:hypothetical protein